MSTVVTTLAEIDQAIKGEREAIGLYQRMGLSELERDERDHLRYLLALKRQIKKGRM